MKKNIVLASLMAASMLSAGIACADEGDDWHFTISAKAWAESWGSWDNINTNSANGPVGTTVSSSDVTAAPIFGATIRYKDFFLSGNSSPTTTFNFSDTLTTQTRSESDFNVGYFIDHQVGISLGYKKVQMNYQPSGSWEHDFVTLGLNSSARVGESSFFMYENAAFSLTGSTTTSQDASFQRAGLSKGNPSYQSLEAGFGVSASQNLIFTLGYKFQQIELPYTYSVKGITENTRDITNGYILGMAVTF